MKINEKSLAKYAESGARPPEREGYLLKKGDFHRSYQKRWFVLKGNLLFYFEKRIDKDPIGVVVLEGCTVDLSDNDNDFEFIIKFAGVNTRTYVMGADTQEDMEGWMKAISGASYEYLKICVSQLKSQLRDLDESSQNALVYGAVKDRNTLRNAGHLKNSPQDSNSSLNHDASAIKRHNPFNTGESFDRESVCNSISEPERRIQTFLEMHEELRAQIEEIMKLWQAQKFQSGPMLGDKNAT